MINATKKMLNFVMICSYFAVAVLLLYKSYYGDRGYVEYQKLQNDIAMANQRKEELKQYKEQLEYNVAGLSGDQPNLDLLEEQIRKKIGYIREDEKVVILK